MNFENIFAVPSFFKEPKTHVISVREDIERPEYAKLAPHYYWHPIDEIFILHSLSSIYAILRIIDLWKKSGVEEIYINCSAGAVRSPLIVESYRYLITGQKIDSLQFVFRNDKTGMDKYITFLNNFKKYEMSGGDQSLTKINLATFCK